VDCFALPQPPLPPSGSKEKSNEQSADDPLNAKSSSGRGHAISPVEIERFETISGDQVEEQVAGSLTPSNLTPSSPTRSNLTAFNLSSDAVHGHFCFYRIHTHALARTHLHAHMHSYAHSYTFTKNLTASACLFSMACKVIVYYIFYTHRHKAWRKPIGYLIFICQFPQKNPIISGSFAKHDLQLQVFYGSAPPCTEREMLTLQCARKGTSFRFGA